MSQTFFTKGVNSTLQLSRGTNFSYQSTGVAIYESTEIDNWYVGDFVSAEYIINAEYGLNERETIHATLVAMPGQSSITVYGRTSLTRPLVNIRSSADSSSASLIVQPASLEVQGSIISFFANYARANLPIYPQSAPAVANSCSWSSSVGTVTSLSITVPTAFVTGPILVGQRVIGTGLPMMATVVSYNVGTQTLVIGGFEPTAFSSTPSTSLTFETGIVQPTSSVQVIQPTKTFKTIMVPGHASIDATTATDHLIINSGDGIDITTDNSIKTLTISATERDIFKSIVVAGQSPVIASGEADTVTLVAGTGIDITTASNSISVGLSGNVDSITASQDLTVLGNSTVDTLLVNSDLDVDGNLTVLGTSTVESLIVNGDLTINGTTTTVNTTTIDVEDINITLGKGATTGTAVNGGGITLDGAGASIVWDNTNLSWSSNKTLIPSSTNTLNLGSLSNYWNTLYSQTIYGSIQTPTQTSITSVGTLTGLTVTGASALAGITASSLTVSGLTSVTTTMEALLDVTSAATVTYNFNQSAIFYHATSPGIDWTAAFTNMPTTGGMVTSVNIIVPQAATAYKITACTVDGVPQTIRWVGSLVPSGTASKTDIWAFSFIRRNNAWVVLASQSANFG